MIKMVSVHHFLILAGSPARSAAARVVRFTTRRTRRGGIGGGSTAVAPLQQGCRLKSSQNSVAPRHSCLVCRTTMSTTTATPFRCAAMRATACSLRNNAFQPAAFLPSFRAADMFPSFFHTADSMLTTSLIFSVVFFVAALVSALVGLAIRVYMAERVRLEHARDMIGGVTGLVVTLVALVLGLLIWTAFGVFSTQKAELQGIAANALEFNQETREYGPEAAHARALMRADLDYAHRQLWGDDQTKAAAIAASIRNMDSLSVVLDHMEPTTDAQKSLLADAKHNYEAIWQSRILMSLQGVDAVSWPVLYVVSAWTCIAFFLTGLNSKSSRATIAVAALGSFCVASAMFLILELSQPYTSSMRVSSDGIDRVGLELEKP